MHLHWEQHPGRGPALLLVHGFLSSRSQWLHNLQALGEVCQPVVVELWGHGRSPSPEDPSAYQPDAYVEQFEAIREALGVDTWFVCGYSLGAGLTIHYANACPDRVTGHIFTNSTSAFADRALVAEWRRTGSESAERLRSGGLAALERIPVHPRHAKRLPEDISRALREDANLHDPVGIAATVEHTTPGVSIRELARSNQTPAMLVNGIREKRFQGHREYIAEHMPLTRIVDVPAGHAVNMESSAEFNQAVIEFIREHSS